MHFSKPRAVKRSSVCPSGWVFLFNPGDDLGDDLGHASVLATEPHRVSSYKYPPVGLEWGSENGQALMINLLFLSLQSTHFRIPGNTKQAGLAASLVLTSLPLELDRL